MKAYLQAANRITNYTEPLTGAFDLTSDVVTEQLNTLETFTSGSLIIDSISVRNAPIVLAHGNVATYRVAYGFRTENGKRQAYRIKLVIAEDQS